MSNDFGGYEEMRHEFLNEAHELLSRMANGEDWSSVSLVADSDSKILGRLEFEIPEPAIGVSPELAHSIMGQMRVFLLLAMSDEGLGEVLCDMAMAIAHQMTVASAKMIMENKRRNKSMLN